MGLIEGKVAIVTGAGAGLGRAYARALAAEGATVVVNDIARAGEDGIRPADSAVAAIIENGGCAVADFSDVSTVTGGQALLDTALGAFGAVDILVNNAGILRDASLLKMEEGPVGCGYLADRFGIVGTADDFVARIDSLEQLGVRKIAFSGLMPDKLAFIKEFRDKVMPRVSPA